MGKKRKMKLKYQPSIPVAPTAAERFAQAVGVDAVVANPDAAKPQFSAGGLIGRRGIDVAAQHYWGPLVPVQVTLGAVTPSALGATSTT